ncbi:unnamed protein product [Anisakis simplex]|uniref:KR domain-containing protein n=1 Tax=Anisakis simplex TaxID=6269 RepID=A0A0M3JR54_ANISI|nr:unnamed protein product [Anisakis simplex]
MNDQVDFVRHDLCWVRTSKTARFYPARIVVEDDLNERQIWSGKPPLYSVIFFDRANVHAGSAYHVRSVSNIKSWQEGMEMGFATKISKAIVNRAVAFQDSIKARQQISKSSKDDEHNSSESDASSYEFEWPYNIAHDDGGRIKQQPRSSNSPTNDERLSKVSGFDDASSSTSSKKPMSEKMYDSTDKNGFQIETDSSATVEMLEEESLAAAQNGNHCPKPADHLEEIQGDGCKQQCVEAKNGAATPSTEVRMMPQNNLTDAANIYQTLRVGWIGANDVSEEVLRVLLKQKNLFVTASLWDQNNEECEQLVKRLTVSEAEASHDMANDGTNDHIDGKGPASTVEQSSSLDSLCACSDVIFCCLDQKTLMHEEKDENGGVELLLDKVLTAAGKANIGVFLMTFFSRVLARAASLMLDDYARNVSVVGVSICGTVGDANTAFLSGDSQLANKYFGIMRCLAKKVILKGGKPSKAMLYGAFYNRFMMGLTFETFAWRAFAAEYGVDNDQLRALISESNLLGDFTNLIVPGVLNAHNDNDHEKSRDAMKQVVTSNAQAKWLISAAMGTYASASNSRAMVQSGVSIYQVMESSKADNFAKAFDEYFNRKI